MDTRYATQVAAEITHSLHVRVAMKQGTTISSLAETMHISRNTVKNRLDSGDLSLKTFLVIAQAIDGDPVSIIIEALEAVNLREMSS